jgi:uncharacterized membrane protein (UPF0127 family)
VKRLATALDTDGGVRFLWWVIGASLVVGFFVWLAVGANGPDDPSLTPRASFGDFSTVSFTVEHGAVTDEFCALLAATDAQRQSGMMGHNDFGGYDGMIFAYPTVIEPARVFFHNRRVPIALTVAWFDAAGKFVASSDMEPCPDREGCPTFRATGPWQYALEVPKAGLGRLGVGPGAVLKVGSAC